MEKISHETARMIQELQLLEQNLQNILLQKQAFQLELNESTLALEELKSSTKEVYKIIGQVMFRTTKEEIEKDLKSKKEIIELRLKNLDKQEETLKEKCEKLRNEVMKVIEQNN